jgi:hypothetical protein
LGICILEIETQSFGNFGDMMSKVGKIENNLFGVLTYDLFLSKCLSGYVGEVVG